MQRSLFVASASAVVVSLLIACSSDGEPIGSANPDAGDGTPSASDASSSDGSSPTDSSDAAPLGSGAIDPAFSGTKGIPANYFRAPITDLSRRVYLLGARERCVDNGATDVVLARLDEHGAVDPTFGTGGRACLNTYVDFAPGDFLDVAGAMAVDAADHLYVAGSSQDTGVAETGTRVFLARFTLDGKPDTTFGTGGKGFVRFSEVAEGHPSSIVIDGQRIWLAGRCKNGGAMLIALDLEGNLVKTFNTNVGLVIDPTVDSFSSVAVRDGSPYVTIAGGAGAGDFLVRKYLPTGAADPEFGVAGTATIAVSPEFDEARSLSIVSDGHLLVAGSAQASAAGEPGSVAVVRLDEHGAIDTTFPAFVSSEVQWPASPDARAFLQMDGKLVAPGIVPNVADLAVVRVGTDGQLDRTYGHDGVLTSGSAKDEMTVAIGVDTSGGAIAIADDGETVTDDGVTLKRPVVYRITP